MWYQHLSVVEASPTKENTNQAYWESRQRNSTTSLLAVNQTEQSKISKYLFCK